MTSVQQQTRIRLGVQSCPAMTSAETEVARVRREAMDRCPAFTRQKTCPFAALKNATSLQDVIDKAIAEHSRAGNPDAARAALDAVLHILEDKPLREGSSSNNKPKESVAPPAVAETVAAKNASTQLSTLLKEETREVHRDAENVAFIRAFVKCKLGNEEYKAYLVRLYHVYVALEESYKQVCTSTEIPKGHQEALRAIWFPEALDRQARIEKDLEFFFGSEWREAPAVTQPSRAVHCYVGRIKQLVEQNPLLLIGHAYTRYLGDLSGGQTLCRVARKSLGLQGEEGTAFYVFPEITSAKKFKIMYRAQLDSLNVTDAESRAIAQEAVLAFRLNIGLFRELDSVFGLEMPSASVSTATEASAATPAKKAVCPFAAGGDTSAAMSMKARSLSEKPRIETIAAPAGGISIAKKTCPFAAGSIPASPKEDSLESKSSETASMSLSSRLKEDTRQVHREAENVSFIRAFIKCKLGKDEFAAFTVRLYHVYIALEEVYEEVCTSEKTKPAHREALRAIWFPKELDRKERIEQDLLYFYGQDWRNHEDVTTLSRAAHCYAGRLRQIAASDPLLLVAHAYTRYMGDLSGGQTLRRVARKSLKLESDEGTAFYEFPEISSAKDFKNMYRAQLDSMVLSEAEAEAISAESILAFRLNIGLFRELDAKFGLAGTEPALSSAMGQQDEHSSVENSASAPKCPFALGSAYVSKAKSFNSRNTTLVALASATLGAVAAAFMLMARSRVTA